MKMSPSHHLMGERGETCSSVHWEVPQVSYKLHMVAVLLQESPLLLLSLNYHSKEHPENSSQEPGNQQPGSQEYNGRMSVFSYITETRFNEEITGRKCLFFLLMAPSTPPITYPYLHSPQLNPTRSQSCRTLVK